MWILVKEIVSLHQLHDINDFQVAPVIIYIVNEKTLKM